MIKKQLYKNGSGSGSQLPFGGKQIKVSFDQKNLLSSNTLTTDEKILISKFNLVGISIVDMIKKYYGELYTNNSITENGGMYVTPNGYVADHIGDVFWDGHSHDYTPITYDSLKDIYFPLKSTNFKDALTKILKGEGVIQNTINTAPVVSTQLDTMMNVASSMNANQQEAIARAKTYSNVGQIGTILALYQMPNSAAAIDSAVSLMGQVPYSGNSGGDWKNNNFLVFYGLVKYLKTYPLPNSKTECTVARSVALSLDEELTSIDTNRKLGNSDDNFNGAFIQAINIIKQSYDSWYANNNCELKISQQASQYTANLTNEATAKNVDLINQATSTPNSTPTTNTISTPLNKNYIIYGAAGLVAIVVILVAIKLVKKNN